MSFSTLPSNYNFSPVPQLSISNMKCILLKLLLPTHSTKLHITIFNFIIMNGLFCSLSPVCMFWGLTTCYRMNSEWTHPRGRLILPPLAVLMSLYFSVSHQIAPCRGSCTTAIVQGLFRQSYCWGIMGAASLPF